MRGNRFAATVCVLLGFGVSQAFAQGGLTKPKQGQGGSVVKGSAGTGGSKGDNGLEHCDAPMGAMAVVEPQDEILVALGAYHLGSPVGLIRMMIQQSNCFIVVERGVGMQNMMQERQLADSGETRAGSNMGRGQMVTADFILTPAVVFSENNAGGVGGGIASGLFGHKAGAIAGGLKFKEAQTSMLVSDSRTGVQVASAEGSTKKADLGVGAGLFGGGFAAVGGGYGNTNEGKIIAAALLNNYNNIVQTVRDDPSLKRSVGSLQQEAAAGGVKHVGGAYDEGDVVVPKIANIKMYAGPSDTSKVVATLGHGEELVIVGAEKDGYLNVQSSNASGWVKAVLVMKR